MKSINEELYELLSAADDIIQKEVISLARNVLEKNTFIHEFIMANGSFFFTGKQKDKTYSIQSETEDLIGYKELHDFIYEWNQQFSVTGNAMRFSLRSGIKTDW